MMRVAIGLLCVVPMVLLAPTTGCERGNAALPRAPSIRLPPPETDDWPCFLGPAHNNTAVPLPGSSADKLAWRELWRRTVGEGYSSPVIVHQRLLLMHRVADNERIECLDAATGEPRWAFSYPSGFRCEVAYSSGPYATPAVAGELVVAIGAEGQVHCLQLATGEPMWQRPLNEEYGVERESYYPVAASPLIDGDRVFFNLGGRKAEAGVVALDLATGRTLWKASRCGASYSTPVCATIGDRRILFVLAREELLGLDAASGQVCWSTRFVPRKPDAFNTTRPLVVGDRVIVSSYSAGALCVRVSADGGMEELWRDSKSLDSQYNNVAYHDGHLYGVASRDNSLHCIDLNTGQSVWRQRWRSGRGAWSLLMGETLLLWGERGHLATLDLAKGAAGLTLIEPPLLSSPCYPAPTYARGRLYLRNDDTLLCVELQRSAPSNRPVQAVLAQD